MSDAGVMIAMGTDSGIANTFPGYFEHREMQLMVDAGMSIPDVIKAATATGASILGMTDGGTLAVGKKADFLSLTANPLDKITNTKEIETMYLNGSQTERTPLIQNITVSVHKITAEEKKNEVNAQIEQRKIDADAKLEHFGKPGFPLGEAVRYKGLTIPTPKYSTSKTAGNVVTVSLAKATAAELKDFYNAAMVKYSWKAAAGSCFEKKAPVTNKTNAACIDTSGGTATVTFTEK
jgi:hypothetical protein